MLSSPFHQGDEGHIKPDVKGGTMFFVANKFPVVLIPFTLLPLPFFMDSGDVTIRVSLLLSNFVSDESHDRNRKIGALCKQKSFSQSLRFGSLTLESFK